MRYALARESTPGVKRSNVYVTYSDLRRFIALNSCVGMNRIGLSETDLQQNGIKVSQRECELLGSHGDECQDGCQDMPCNLVDVDQRFRGYYCSITAQHPRRQTFSDTRKFKNGNKYDIWVSHGREHVDVGLLISNALKMEEVCLSEMLTATHKSTRRYYPEYQHRQIDAKFQSRAVNRYRWWVIWVAKDLCWE